MKKSDVKSLMSLLEALLQDCYLQSDGANPVRDMKYIRGRVEKEGESFLTITLPTLGKDFEQSLEQEQILSTHFRAFRKYGTIPSFLKGMFQRVFDHTTGALLPDPCVQSIFGIRQIAYAFKKIEGECDPKRVASALREYRKCDEQLPVDQGSFDPDRLAWLSQVSQYLWPLALSKAEKAIESYGLCPKHGPGATAERYLSNEKWRFKRWHERLENFLPFTEYATANLRNIEDDLDSVVFVPPDQEQPVRVVTVPKTMKGPRIIAIEPSCMQFAQQSLLHAMTDSVTSHLLTKKVFNFHDQRVNQRMAKYSSRSKKYATLDLSEASDRVSYVLARSIFCYTPILWAALDSCRSKRADVTIDGRKSTIDLRKFASMGSGVCFPIEAMVFYTILLSCELHASKLPLTWDTLLGASRKIRVFGDDIIVPTTLAPVAIDWLESFGLKVNRTKTFIKGNFRESCGVDAYNGTEISPIYVRSKAPLSKRDGSAVISWVSTANQFYLKGLWRACEVMRRHIDRLIDVPYAPPAAGYLSRTSLLFKSSWSRWCQDLSTGLVRGTFSKTHSRSDPLDGFPALNKCLSSLRGKYPDGKIHHNLSWLDIQPVNAEHLTQSVRRGVVSLTSRWVPFQ